MAETTCSLSNSRWDCKYPIVFIPKRRRAAPYRNLRKYLGEMFRNPAQQKECRMEEGHLAAFLNAYNFAKRLKTLAGLSSFQFICSCRQKQPDRFITNPRRLSLGLNAPVPEAKAKAAAERCKITASL